MDELRDGYSRFERQREELNKREIEIHEHEAAIRDEEERKRQEIEHKMKLLQTQLDSQTMQQSDSIRREREALHKQFQQKQQVPSITSYERVCIKNLHLCLDFSGHRECTAGFAEEESAARKSSAVC